MKTIKHNKNNNMVKNMNFGHVIYFWQINSYV